jgi:hypothetical protein
MLDQIFWWVGAIVCGSGALAALAFVLYWPVDYCWRVVWDFDAFCAVLREANRQGRSLRKSARSHAADIKE